MPFESEAQRRFMWAKHPQIAKRWAHEYPGQGPKNLPLHVNTKQPIGSKKFKAYNAAQSAGPG